MISVRVHLVAGSQIERLCHKSARPRKNPTSGDIFHFATILRTLTHNSHTHTSTYASTVTHTHTQTPPCLPSTPPYRWHTQRVRRAHSLHRLHTASTASTAPPQRLYAAKGHHLLGCPHQLTGGPGGVGMTCLVCCHSQECTPPLLRRNGTNHVVRKGGGNGKGAVPYACTCFSGPKKALLASVRSGFQFFSVRRCRRMI